MIAEQQIAEEEILSMPSWALETPDMTYWLQIYGVDAPDGGVCTAFRRLEYIQLKAELAHLRGLPVSPRLKKDHNPPEFDWSSKRFFVFPRDADASPRPEIIYGLTAYGHETAENIELTADEYLKLKTFLAAICRLDDRLQLATR